MSERASVLKNPTEARPPATEQENIAAHKSPINISDGDFHEYFNRHS